MCLSGRRTCARLRNGHVLYPLLGSIRFTFGRKDLTVGGEQMRWCVKDLLMMVETGAELVCVGWIARQDGIAANNAAFDFIEPDDPTKFHLFAEFAFADNGCMRFKQADQLIPGRHTFAVEHPALGLAPDLLYTGHKGGQLVGQAPSGGLTNAL